MIEFLAGQSLLTTIDAPAVSHVSRASARKPLPGALVLPDVRSIMQAAADLDLPQPRREDSPRSVSVEVVDAALMDAFVRLVELLGEPDMVPRLASLVLQEITIRLLTGPHGAQLLHTKLDQLDAVTREAHPVMHASSIHELAGRVLELMAQHPDWHLPLGFKARLRAPATRAAAAPLYFKPSFFPAGRRFH